MIAAGYKWLLGPYGFGFMYIANKHLQGKPLENNWINRSDSENFSGLVNYKDNYSEGARRFDVGQKSLLIKTPMMIAALAQIQSWGIENIASYTRHLTNHLVSRLENTSLSPIPIHERAPHICGINFNDQVPEKLINRLKK